MPRSDIRALLDQLVDVVVQCGVEGQRRFCEGGVVAGSGA